MTDFDLNSIEYKDILNRINRAKEYVKGWHTNIKRWRRLYDMQHYQTKPKQREVQYSDPTYTNTVDLAIGIMLANRLKWHAFGFVPSWEEQQETSQIEKLLDGTLAVNDQREEMNQLYQLYLFFTRDGGAAIYSVFDPQLAMENKFQKQIGDVETGSRTVWAFKEPPLRVQVIDPTAIICLPGGPKRWLMIGRCEHRTVLDVEAQFGIRLEKYRSYSEEQKATTEEEFMDVWDWAYAEQTSENEITGPRPVTRLVVRNTIMFAGQPIQGPRIMEGYDDLPYTIQFYKPTDPKDPSQWHSILSPLEATVTLLERAFNRRAHQIDVFTALPLVSKTQLGRPVKVDEGLFSHVNMTPDESLEFPAWNGNPPDISNQLEFLRSRIQQSGFSDVMFGSGQGASAGYALSQLGDQNRIRLEQPITHLELMLSTWAKKSMKLLQKFAPGAYVCVYGQHKGKDYLEYVKVEDLDEYSVRAEILPEFPNEETRKSAMATQAKGTLSDYTIMEKFYGIEQPDDEEQRKAIEAIVRHPLYQEFIIREQLTDMAKAGNEVAKLMLMQMQQQAMGTGQPGRPAEPRNPEQLTGTQSPTGQPVPQALGESPAKSPEETAAGASPQMTGVVE